MKNTPIKEGQIAPEFCLPDTDEKDVCLADFRGNWVVLYFYPKDNTTGCSLEASDFTRLKRDFESEGARIIGVSKDSCKSHRNFRDKKSLTITLLSDEDVTVHKKYGVWRMKKFVGREFLGTIRTTFLIDPQGKVAKIWDGVKVTAHAEEVLETLKNKEKSFIRKDKHFKRGDLEK